jgi:hypothetical protein
LEAVSQWPCAYVQAAFVKEVYKAYSLTKEMRVNIIGNTNSLGLAQDIHILHGMIFHTLGKGTVIRHVPHFHPQCEEADINFFVESINPALFQFAAKNVWVPNPEWTQASWKPYGRMVDEIWVKTREAEKLFADWGTVRYINWTSVDKTVPEKKDYSRALVPVGKNVWRHPKPIVQAYMRIQQTDADLYSQLPIVDLVYNSIQVPPIPSSVADKFVVHSERISEKEYDALVAECGLVICTSAAEGFCHAVNEAMSAESILLLSPIEPFRELTTKAIWVSGSKSVPHPECLGMLEDVDVGSIVDALTVYTKMSHHQRRAESRANRDRYEHRHQNFLLLIDAAIKAITTDLKPYSLQSMLPKEQDLPFISVITITRDRRAFIPLVKYGLIAQTYPAEKIEWIIVDDGKDQIKDLVSDMKNVVYVLADEPMTIGAKRNLAVTYASHDILVNMDDDDVYPSNSLLSRVAHMLAEPKKECLFSTVIPCYDIHEKKSFMNVPPIKLPMCERVSEATLCFTWAFWEAGRFPDQQIAEGGGFIRGREHQCRELSPQDVIVSLIHKKNTSSRKAPPMAEPNGCHYGFSDELFTLVTEIGQSI